MPFTFLIYLYTTDRHVFEVLLVLPPNRLGKQMTPFNTMTFPGTSFSYIFQVNKLAQGKIYTYDLYADRYTFFYGLKKGARYKLD